MRCSYLEVLGVGADIVEVADVDADMMGRE